MASEATFIAGPEGEIETALQKPISGTYGIADSMGLLWSMYGEPEPDVSFGEGSLEPVKVSFRAEVEGEVVAKAQFEWRFTAPGVQRKEVRENGLAGTLFLPKGNPPFPAIIVLGGSGGGLSEMTSALLASHGIASLALAYFAFEQLPPTLNNIPLEYFEKAMSWLKARPEVASETLTVMGASRGGELALLLGATFSDIRAVVGWVPSGLIHAGLPRTTSGLMPAWTYRGEGLPFVAADFDTIDWDRKPIKLTPGFLAELTDDEAVEAATIPVERINGPVLLISGADDQMWPSSTFSEMVINRLHSFKHPFQSIHHSYEGAGHVIKRPYLPCGITHSIHPVTGFDYDYGGTPSGYLKANIDSWKRTLTFLEARFEALGQPVLRE